MSEPPAASATPEEDAGNAARYRSRWALGPAGLALLALATLFFLFVSYLPLGSGAVWGDVLYGGWILEHGTLPAEDPILPLAEGMPVVATPWLSQVLLAAVDRAGGAQALATFFSLWALATMLILGWIHYRQTGSRRWGVLGAAATLALSWSRWSALGPESFGVLCFVLLLCFVAERPAQEEATARLHRWSWLGVPLLFLLWANLHSSFLYGLAVLCCCLVGRLAEVGWQTRSPRSMMADPQARRWFLLTEFAALATLVNPYGIDLWLRPIWFPAEANLRQVIGWQPLAMVGPAGWAFGLSVVLLLFAFRHSRRRVPVAHVLLLVFFALAAVAQARMLAWYGPVFTLVAVPHLAAMAARPRARRAGALVPRFASLAVPSWRYSILALVFLWAAFALSPLGSSWLRGGARPVERTLPARTPVALAAYLRANPPAPPGSQVFNPLAWGDWLAREGPAGMRLFATSRVQQLPARVWRDYLRIEGNASEWQRALDRYGVGTAIFDRALQRPQMQNLRFTAGWTLAYEDDLAAVFVRGSGAASPTRETPPESGSTGDAPPGDGS